MEISLSARLKICCGFVCPGDRVADIGCDHGYLGIYLLKTGKAASVIAADVKTGPLESAVKNAEKYGVTDRISFHLSDGVQNVPRDFDTLVCAGMGADTMITILQAAPWLKSNKYRLILQCQSKTPLLRSYLSEQGYRITEESVVRDGRFLYTVMEVCWQPGYSLSAGECYFPPALLENPSAELPEYYSQVISKLRRVVNGQKENTDPKILAALSELETLADTPELKWLKEKL